MSGDLFNNVINEDFDYLIEQIGKSIKINGSDVVAILNNNNDEFDTKDIITKSDLKSGDIVDYSNSKWLIMDSVNDERYDYYNKSIIRKCNTSIKFLFDNNQIVEFPTIIDVQQTFDVSTGQVISVPVGKIVCVLQNNIDTSKLVIGKRFVKWSTAFKITGIDYTKEGLIYLYAEKDEINSSVDNMDLEIANYYDHLHTYSIDIQNGESSSLTIGESLQLICICKDNNIIVSNTVVTYQSSNPEICTVDSNGLVKTVGTGSCVISATYQGESDSINIEVKIIVPPTTHDIIYSLTGSDTISWGMKKNYTCAKYDNGVAFSGAQFIFTIDTQGNVSDIASLTVIDDSNVRVTVKKDQKLIGKTFKLVCSDKADSSKTVVKVIEIIALGM